jgi:hypothetical protein
MQQSSHSTLTVALAVGFGAALVASLTPNTAIGYPTSAVATGTNPVVSAGGEVGYLSTSTVFEPYDERLIITDVVLTMFGNHSTTQPCLNRVSIDSEGRELARFHLVSDTYQNADYLQPTQVSHSYSSGLPVEPGATIGITNHDEHCKVAYSVSGYLASP